MTEINLPSLSLVALVGISGSGKSTFAAKHFLPTEVLSSDFFRGLVSDDENDQAASRDAFESLYFLAAKRLARGRLTVIDATNVQADARKHLIAVAREHDVLPVAIVLDVPERLAIERNGARADRDMDARVISRMRADLRRSLKSLQREGFRHVFVLHGPEEIEAATITRTKHRRPAHGAEVSRARAGVRARRARLLRAGQALPDGCPAGTGVWRDEA